MTAQFALKRPPLPRPSAPAQLKCGWELPSAIAKELTLLARRFSDEFGLPPYDIDWDRVFALERAGLLRVWTARTPAGALTGCLTITFNRGLFTSTFHHRIETGFLSPEWRSGALGVRFIKSAVAAIGPGPVEWETNDAFEPDANGRSRLATLLERLGFKQVGTTMRRA